MPSSVTIQLKRIPTCLREEIAQSENKSATLAGLLEEFAALRYSAPQDELAHKSSQIHDLNDQVRALRLDLNGSTREIEEYKTANEELGRRIEHAEAAIKDALSLISYLGKVGHGD